MKKVFFLLLLAVGFAIPAFSQMMDMPMREHRARHERMMNLGTMDHMDDVDCMMGICVKHADELGVNDDQISKMNSIRRDMQKKQIRFKADLKIAEIDLMEVMEVKDFDMEKASATVNKIEGIKTTHHIEMLKDKKEMRNILSDEQFKKMKKMFMKNDDD